MNEEAMIKAIVRESTEEEIKELLFELEKTRKEFIETINELEKM